MGLELSQGILLQCSVGTSPIANRIWHHIALLAIVSHTSDVPQNDIDSYLGLYYYPTRLGPEQPTQLLRWLPGATPTTPATADLSGTA